MYAETPERAQIVPAGFSATDLLLLCMALIWGVNFIVVKFATSVFAPLAFNSVRILLALVAGQGAGKVGPDIRCAHAG